ncbi:MAG: hypothetical protein IJG17_00375, partial [Eubacterium sp.]|nr:hypothetical protein [Eubacterium sp.]
PSENLLNRMPAYFSRNFYAYVHNFLHRFYAYTHIFSTIRPHLEFLLSDLKLPFFGLKTDCERESAVLCFNQNKSGITGLQFSISAHINLMPVSLLTFASSLVRGATDMVSPAECTAIMIRFCFMFLTLHNPYKV